VLLSIMLLACSVALPARIWWVRAASLAWATGGLIFAFAIAHVRYCERRIRDAVTGRGRAFARARRLRDGVLAVGGRLVDEPLLWPVFAVGGPAAGLTAVHVLSTSQGGAVLGACVFATALSHVTRVAFQKARRAPGVIAVGDLSVAVAVWITIGAGACFLAGWPTPAPGFVPVGVALDLTLLAAAMKITTVPEAWRVTPQLTRAWTASTQVVALAGLTASLAAAVSGHTGAMLLPVVLAPVAAVATAWFVDTHYAARRLTHDVAPRTIPAPTSQSHRHRQGARSRRVSPSLLARTSVPLNGAAETNM